MNTHLFAFLSSPYTPFNSSFAKKAKSKDLAFFNVKQSGNYISHQKELLQVVSSDERIIVETFLHLKSGGKVDFNFMSETLFARSKKWISEKS